jgi:hypothetical protein
VTRFLKIASGIDTMGVLLDLNRAPHLWDQNTTRKTYPGTPHAEMSDIWVRFRAPDQIKSHSSHKDEYRNVFWPAWHEMPSLRPLVASLKTRVDAVELGSILITKLPPGGAIMPHDDRGSWAAEFYNSKVHVTLAGSSLSRCGDETVTMTGGDVWTFDNLIEHDVQNVGNVDRIALIVSMRVEV